MYGSGLDRLKYRCVPEINQMVERIGSFEGLAFDPWHIFYDSACNIMLDLVNMLLSSTHCSCILQDYKINPGPAEPGYILPLQTV